MPNKIKKLKKKVAAGGILHKIENNELKILLIHRPKYDDWSLPKGKQDAKENVFDTAVREIKEETGFSVTLKNYIDKVEYRLENKIKTVHYWNTEIVSGKFKKNSEVDQILWLNKEQALQKASKNSDKKVIELFFSHPQLDSSTTLFYFSNFITDIKKMENLHNLAKSFGAEKIIFSKQVLQNEINNPQTLTVITKKQFPNKLIDTSQKKVEKNKFLVITNNGENTVMDFYKNSLTKKK